MRDRLIIEKEADGIEGHNEDLGELRLEVLLDIRELLEAGQSAQNDQFNLVLNQLIENGQKLFPVV